MWCSNCGVEYTEGLEICDNCRLSLVKDLQMLTDEEQTRLKTQLVHIGKIQYSLSDTEAGKAIPSKYARAWKRLDGSHVVGNEKNKFLLIPSIGGLLFCLAFTIFTCGLLSQLFSSGDPASILGGLSGAAFMLYYVWARIFHLLPSTIRDVTVESNKIVFRHAGYFELFIEGKHKIMIEPIERVFLSNNSLIVEGLNSKNKRVKKTIMGNWFKKDDYEKIKTILLKDKIES